MRNIIGLVILGIILKAIDLAALFYHVIHRVGQPPETVISQVYPYQGGGILLVVAGIIFISLGVWVSISQKDEAKEQRHELTSLVWIQLMFL